MVRSVTATTADGESVTQTDYAATFNQSFASTPAFFAAAQSFDGSDTAGVRMRSLDGNGVL